MYNKRARERKKPQEEEGKILQGKIVDRGSWKGKECVRKRKGATCKGLGVCFICFLLLRRSMFHVFVCVDLFSPIKAVFHVFGWVSRPCLTLTLTPKPFASLLYDSYNSEDKTFTIHPVCSQSPNALD